MIDEVMRGQLVEGDLDRLIERRAEGADHANAAAAAERLAAESRACRYREAVLWQKLEFHRLQLERHTRTFTRLIDRYKGALRLVEEALGITTEEERKTA